MHLSTLDQRPRAARNTRQKAAIRTAFEAANRPLGAPEVLELAARQAYGLGIATVYRNIKSLVDDGWLRAVEIPGEAPRYERALRNAKHDHFQCKACGKVFAIAACDVSTRGVLPRGFKLGGHRLLLYGSCGACAK